MTLGQTIRYLRQSAGLSQVELASKADISAAYLSQLENDRRGASVSLLRELASQLGAPAALLFATALAGDNTRVAPDSLQGALDRLVEAVGANLSQQILPALDES